MKTILLILTLLTFNVTQAQRIIYLNTTVQENTSISTGYDYSNNESLFIRNTVQQPINPYQNVQGVNRTIPVNNISNAYTPVVLPSTNTNQRSTVDVAIEMLRKDSWIYKPRE